VAIHRYITGIQTSRQLSLALDRRQPICLRIHHTHADPIDGFSVNHMEAKRHDAQEQEVWFSPYLETPA